MKTLTIVLFIFLVTIACAQRKISGIIYSNGKPQAGILVTANRSNDSFYTSFDGKYEIKIHEKTKFLTFSFLEESKKLTVEGNTSDVINFSWDGQPIPETFDEPSVILKSREQLYKEGDKEFSRCYSLYHEFFKQDDIISALPYWKKLYQTYPKSTQRIYIDGVKIFETLMGNALDSHTKILYLDTIMSIYDKRIKYFENAGELLGRKAANYLETILQPSMGLNEDELIKGVYKGYGLAEKSIATSGDNTEPMVIVLFLQATKKLYQADSISKTDVIDNYENAISILESQLTKPEQKEKAEQAMPLVEKIIEGCSVLDCKALIELYEPKFKQNPNDISLIKKIIKMLKKENCTDSELYVQASEMLFQLEPNAESAFNMGNMFVKKSKFDKAFEYYEKAYSSETDPEKKATYLYYAAMLGLQRDRFQFASDMSKEALKLKPDFCEVYLLLGEIFAQASKSFSTIEFERSTVFWIAVDYFEKASRYPNCETDGKNKATFYSNYFPNIEDVFLESLVEGNKYLIGGWINETTTIRAKKQ